MIVTANSDYTVITIQSDNLKDFSTISSVTLNGKILCEGTYTDTIVEGDVTLSTGTFTVDLATLFATTSALADSIYSFDLVINTTSSTVIREYGCLFVDNETSCKVVDKVVETNNIEIQLDYYLLSRAQTCSCTCDDLCVIFKRLTNELTRCTSC